MRIRVPPVLAGDVDGDRAAVAAAVGSNAGDATASEAAESAGKGRLTAVGGVGAGDSDCAAPTVVGGSGGAGKSDTTALDFFLAFGAASVDG